MKRRQPTSPPTDALAATPAAAPADDPRATPETLAGALPAWDLLPEAPILRRR